jgi:hypothetical protein
LADNSAGVLRIPLSPLARRQLAESRQKWRLMYQYQDPFTFTRWQGLIDAP